MASETMIGRNINVNLKLLNPSFNNYERIVTLKVVDVLGDYCVTCFEKCEYSNKKQFPEKNTSLITAFTDVKTGDGYTLRFQVVGVTGKQQKQLKSNCYANNSQKKALRLMMQNEIQQEFSGKDLNSCCNSLFSNVAEEAILKSSRSIYSFSASKIFKMKVVASPQLDLVGLLSHHGGVDNFKSSLANSSAKMTDIPHIDLKEADEGEVLV
ncbi:MAG: ribosomal 40S subunit protein S1B [Paramarteilia canceri]